jgi:hypothetical protein
VFIIVDFACTNVEMFIGKFNLSIKNEHRLLPLPQFDGPVCVIFAVFLTYSSGAFQVEGM